MDSYKIIDLFAGIGGIRLGFSLGFGDIECVFTSELDKNCRKVYKENFNDKHEYDEDITKTDISKIPKYDILLAGFPCQSFSLAGKRKGFEDSRGILFFYIVNIIKQTNPPILFLENVKGLLSHDSGKTFKIIKRFLKRDLGYHIYYKVLDAQNYNLAQHRERVYIVGFKTFRKFKFPPAITSQPKIRNILDENPDEELFISQQRLDNMKLKREKLKSGFGYVVRSLDSIAATLTKGGEGETNLIIDNRIINNKNEENIRRFSISEIARLQGFPNNFKFDNSKTNSYKQLGNSVAVNVVKEIAKNIKYYYEDDSNIIIQSPTNMIIIEFMQAMYDNGVFDGCFRKAIKKVYEIIESESIEIWDVNIFFDYLIKIGLIKRITDIYIQFDSDINVKDICEFINYVNQKLINYDSSYPNSQIIISSVVRKMDKVATTIFLLSHNNKWAFAYKDYKMCEIVSCTDEFDLKNIQTNDEIILQGLIRLLELISEENLKIYIKNKKISSVLFKEGYGIIDSLFEYSTNMNNWISENWNFLSVAEFENIKRLDIEIKKHLYNGSSLEFRRIRVERCNKDDCYIECEKLLK